MNVLTKLRLDGDCYGNRKDNRYYCPCCGFSFWDDKHDNGAFHSTDRLVDPLNKNGQFYCWKHEPSD